MTKPTLTTHSGQTIPVGGTAELDGNLPVTVTAIRPPCDDEDAGSVTIQFGWGAKENVAPIRLGAYIAP